MTGIQVRAQSACRAKQQMARRSETMTQTAVIIIFGLKNTDMMPVGFRSPTCTGSL